MEKTEELLEEFENALLSVDRAAVEKLITEASEAESPLSVVSGLVTEALERIGTRWEAGSLSLSQVYMSGLLCEEAIDRVLPPSDPMRKSQPKMAIGVFEDHHVLGKRIVYSTLRASGYELLDFGSGLAAPDVIRLTKEHDIKVLLLSTLMLPSALKIKQVTAALKGSGVMVIVGGAPFRFDEELWREVGADASGKDASAVIRILNTEPGEVK